MNSDQDKIFRSSAIAYEIGKYTERVYSISYVYEQTGGTFPRRYIATSSSSELRGTSCAEGTYKVKTHVAHQQPMGEDDIYFTK